MNTRSKNHDSTKLSPKVPGKISSYFERESLDSNSEVNMEKRLSKLIEQSSRRLMDNLNKFKDKLMVKFDTLVSENDILREKVMELEKGLQFAQERAEESVQIADRCVKENSELTDKLDKIESSWLNQFSTIRAEKKLFQEALNKLERYTREWNLRFSGFEEINGEDCKSKIVEFISENQLFPGSTQDIYIIRWKLLTIQVNLAKKQTVPSQDILLPDLISGMIETRFSSLLKKNTRGERSGFWMI